MFQTIGIVAGVAVGWVFGVILAAILRVCDVSPQTVEKVAFGVSLPALLVCGAWGGLLGYRRDRRGSAK